MATAEHLERFSKLPVQHKILAFLLISAFFGAVFYFVFYSDMMDQETRLENQINLLQVEKSNYENKKRQYDTFRAEVNKLLEKQKELLKVLPTDAEIHTLLQSIHAQAELSGLNILTFEQQPEVKEQFYARIPVKMAISGSFFQIMKFFFSVGQLKRIVNIQELALGDSQQTERGVALKAKFIASTFRFVAQQSAPGAPAGPPGQAVAPAPSGG